MPGLQKDLRSPTRRAIQAAVQVLLLVVLVPLGIAGGWMVLAPSAQNLASRAAGGGDSAALLELVQRAPVHQSAAAELDLLLGHDAGALRALVDLAAGHESAMLQLVSVARTHPERMGHLSGVQMSYPFAEALLRHMHPRGMEILQKLAVTRPNAAFVLAVACETGVHVPQNWGEAARWYAAAANLGLEMATSYYSLAAYEAGLCCHREAARAAESAAWFRAAAECGNAAAQCALGVCYSSGAGVPRDLTQAVAWYEKSASQGFVDAMFNLGMCYLYGEGTNRDVAAAADWFQKAANAGDDLAQYYLGRAYELGEGVPQSDTRAVLWYRLAAEQGRAEAQLALASCYEQGRGVQKDAAAAQYWRTRAEKDFKQPTVSISES